MVTKDYKPAMKPQLVPAAPPVPALIKVSRAYLVSLPLTMQEHIELEKACVGQSICPAAFWYPDTERMRGLLKADG